MKFKKLISLLAATAMVVTAVTGAMTASASEVANGTCGDLTWTLDSDGVLTLSGEGAMASPQTVNSLGATIERDDFSETYSYKKYKDKITEVEIEKGVTSIGYCAFYQFPNLETVSLPSTITEFISFIDPRPYLFISCAFMECPKLKNLTLSEGMTTIGGYAFYKCTALESVRIPSTLTVQKDMKGDGGWGAWTFAYCSSLKNVTLPEGLTVIGADAFVDTAIESIVIPSTIRTWSIRTEPNNAAIHNNAFMNCKNLSSVTFTNGLTCITNAPFKHCESLKKLMIPASVTDLTYAFNETGGILTLEEVAFDDGSELTELSKQVFRQCGKLKTFEIPENVTKTDRFINNCDSLEVIYVYSPEVELGDLRNNVPNNVKIYCYSDSKTWNSAFLNGYMCYDIGEEMSKTYEELSKAVEEANKYSEKDYTAESYGVLKELLEQASTKSEKSHVLGMRYLTEDINSAVKALVKKPAQDSVKPGTTRPSTDNKITNTKSQAQKNAENAMKQAKITKLTVKSKAKKKITVTWKKVSKANGYQVQVSTNKKFKKSKIILTKTTSKKKITIKKLKSKKTYFVRVRAYATYKDSNGKPQKVYSSWIKKTRKVKVK